MMARCRPFPETCSLVVCRCVTIQHMVGPINSSARFFSRPLRLGFLLFSLFSSVLAFTTCFLYVLHRSVHRPCKAYECDGWSIVWHLNSTLGLPTITAAFGQASHLAVSMLLFLPSSHVPWRSRFSLDRHGHANYGSFFVLSLFVFYKRSERGSFQEMGQKDMAIFD